MIFALLNSATRASVRQRTFDGKSLLRIELTCAE